MTDDKDKTVVASGGVVTGDALNSTVTVPSVAEIKKPSAKPKDKAKKVVVQFIAPWGRYVKNDVSGFDPKKAAQLIDKLKVAVAYSAKSQKASKSS